VSRPLPPSFEAILLEEALDREATLDAFVLGLRRGPWVTGTLVAGMVAIHLVLVVLDGAGPPEELLIAAGARVSEAVAIGESWRMVSCLLLHADWLHLGLNMLALFGLGRLCEAIFGPARLLALFLFAGLGGSVLAQLGPASTSVGASGAVFGMMGAAIAFGVRRRKVLPYGLRRLLVRGLLPWVVLNLVIGFAVPFIDNLGHIGGLVVGSVAGWVLCDAIVPGPEPSRGRAGALAGLCAGVLAWAISNAGRNLLGEVGRWM